MKYTRLTKRIADGEEAFLFHSSLHEGIERLAELEDKIKSGELCDREEVRKETAKEIAEMLKAAKGVVKVHFEAYDELIENIYWKYGIESVGNSDKLELGGNNND